MLRLRLGLTALICVVHLTGAAKVSPVVEVTGFNTVGASRAALITPSLGVDFGAGLLAGDFYLLARLAPHISPWPCGFADAGCFSSFGVFEGGAELGALKPIASTPLSVRIGARFHGGNFGFLQPPGSGDPFGDQGPTLGFGGVASLELRGPSGVSLIVGLAPRLRTVLFRRYGDQVAAWFEVPFFVGARFL